MHTTVEIQSIGSEGCRHLANNLPFSPDEQKTAHLGLASTTSYPPGGVLMNVGTKTAVGRRKHAAFAPIGSDLVEDLSARAEQETAVRKALAENPVPVPDGRLGHWSARLGAGMRTTVGSRLSLEPFPRLLWRGL